MAAVLTDAQHAAASSPRIAQGEVTQRHLIGLLVRMKWALWKRSYRKNVGRIVGTVFGVLYALFGLGLLVFVFLGTTLWTGEGGTFPLIIRGVGAVTVLAWLLVPLLAFGVDDTLDPRRFAPLPLSARRLQPGMFAAAALSLPSILTLVAVAIATAFEVIWLLAFGQGAVWVVLALLALVPANLAGLALCLLLPRAVYAHSASRSSSRSGRELGGIIAMVLIFVVIYGAVLVMQRIAEIDLDAIGVWIPQAVEIIAWTPFGALFAVPMDLAEGRVLTALGRALVGAAAIALTWLWWRRSLDASLTSALSGDASSGSAKVSALVPRAVRPGPFGAVMGKSLRYWRRDTRYLAALGIYPVIVVFMVAMGLVLPDFTGMSLALVIFICGFSGVSLSNEIGFDGPSGWVNITADLPARANLLGRIAAMAVFVVPGVLIVTIAAPVLLGAPELLPLTVLASFGALLTGWGASLAVGVLLPYPTSPPGTNPLKDKSTSSTNAFLSMTLSTVAVFVPQTPALALGIWGVAVGSLPLQLLAGAVSLLAGVLVFLGSGWFAQRRLERRAPDLFQRVRDEV